MANRTEAEVFAELGELCASPGYVHSIAYFCYRDNIVRYSQEMTAADLTPVRGNEKLSRTEISTLIGLMVKAPIDWHMPRPDVMEGYIKRSEELLHEMHVVMSSEAFQLENLVQLPPGSPMDPFSDGRSYREPIFYSGESAYLFQYVDMAGRKYAADADWLAANKGVQMDAAQEIARHLQTLQTDKLTKVLEAMKKQHPDEWTVLPAFKFSLSEVVERTGIEASVVEGVLEAFSLATDTAVNSQFSALHDFNVVNALPVLKVGTAEYLLLQGYGLAEALYDTPFFWMGADKAYVPTAMGNRGRFTEDFTTERLKRVFGAQNVFPNVDVYKGKQRVGEIDVLVLFANRAIVLQAKSKRLTLEARKGNDKVIKDDFKKSVQDSYDQGWLCATKLNDGDYRFVGANGVEVVKARDFKEVFILCVVLDHYPALSYQTRGFLKHQADDVIKRPLVLDVFALDAITELLDSPLKCLSYLNKRTTYAERLLSSQELTILSFHLRQGLWFDDEYQLVMLSDDVSSDLDIAMFVRRTGVLGAATPDGILTRYVGTTLWRVIEDIENKADAGTIDLGMVFKTPCRPQWREGW